MSNLDILPNEVLFHILSLLDHRDVLRVAQTCRRLHQLANLDSLWENLCAQDYQFLSKDGWGTEDTTYFDIYSEVLVPFGKCRGLWRNSKSTYGIFVHVNLERGQIVGRVCKYPESYDVRDPLLWSVPVFTITLKEGKGQVLCRKGCLQPQVSLDLKHYEKTLNFHCDVCSKLEGLKDENLLQTWTCDIAQSSNTARLLRLKNLVAAKATKLMSSVSLQRIPPTVQSPASPITLGFYKGTYGGHGVEILHLRMDDTGCLIHGDKILGDPNVPAGEISLYINLKQPMTLTADQQDMDFAESFTPDTLPSPYRFPAGASQPFALDPGVHARDEERPPTSCIARYGGQGQIAGHGFVHPEKIPGHFVVFSEKFFGFLWISLCSFSFYRLVEEDLS